MTKYSPFSTPAAPKKSDEKVAPFSKAKKIHWLLHYRGGAERALGPAHRLQSVEPVIRYRLEHSGLWRSRLAWLGVELDTSHLAGLVESSVFHDLVNNEPAMARARIQR